MFSRAALRPILAASQPIFRQPNLAGLSINRSFHQSSSVQKKKPKSKALPTNKDPEAEEEEFESENDLFNLSETENSKSSPLIELAELNKELNQTVRAALEVNPYSSNKELRERNNILHSIQLRTLRRIVQLTPEEDIESVREVLRKWRIINKKVTKGTSAVIVELHLHPDRLCDLNRPEMAAEILADRVQYGLSGISVKTQTKLHHLLLTSPSTSTSTSTLQAPRIPLFGVSPTLALLHLALRRKLEPQRSLHISEIDQLLKSVSSPSDQEVEDFENLREEGRKILMKAGGVWADAVRRIDDV